MKLNKQKEKIKKQKQKEKNDIKKAIQKYYNMFMLDFELEYEPEYELYGERWVRTGEYATEQSLMACLDAFKTSFDYKYFLNEILEEVPSTIKYKNKLKRIVKMFLLDF